MGLDGGTIISRSDVLRGSSWRLAQADGSRSTRGGSVSSSSVYKAPQVEQDVQRTTSWTTCSISGQPLAAPIVACGLGSLYNKDAVLEFCLGRKGVFADAAAATRFANQLRAANGALDHLLNKRDVFELHLTPNEALGPASTSRAASSGASGASTSQTPYMCPVTKVPCGKLPFSALRTCGCVVSDKALALAGGGVCPACDRPYQPGDVVPINGTEQQVQGLRKRLAEQAAKSSKASKRRRAEADTGDSGVAGKVLCVEAVPAALPHQSRVGSTSTAATSIVTTNGAAPKAAAGAATPAV